MSGQLHALAALTSGGRTSIHWGEGWVVLTASLNAVGGEKNILPRPSIEPPFIGRPGRSLVNVMAELSRRLPENYEFENYL